MQYPENGGYLIAAYVMAAAVVLGYAVSLLIRLRKAGRVQTSTGER